MSAPEPAAETEVCPCSQWEDCDHHACCEGCPDNGEFWCGDCWARDCYDHNIRDLVELLADYEKEGRPQSRAEPIVKLIEDWHEKYGRERQQNPS